MAFENPLLRPSATRQAALQYLWSDEPESAIQAAPAPSSSSSIGNFFGVGEASPSTGQATPAATTAPVSAEGSDSSSGIAVAEATPYGGLFGGLPSLAVNAINMGVPGFGAMYGAASGYAGQTSANNLGTAMDAWGGDPNVSGSPALAALGGAFGYTPEGLENAQAFAGNFGNEANMAGYMAAADSSTPIGSLTQAIAATQLGQTNEQMTPDQYGQLGLATVNAVNTSMASGKSLSQAMTDVGVAQGVPTTAIAAIAANVNTQDPIGQLAANLGVAPDPQVAVNAQANAMPVDPGIQAAVAAQAAQTSAESESAAATEGYSEGGWVDSWGNPVTDSSGRQVQTTESAASMAAAEASDASGNAAAAAAMADQGIGIDAFGGTGDDGGGGGGGKIICTAMNEAYGFGSFRNAIWIKYSNQHLTKEHEKGYHALFLPLVDYGFKQGDGTMNKIVRKVLEWGTRHRSTDLRAEMRGKKRDTTGRIIRAIFEPLCYFVGKYK